MTLEFITLVIGAVLLPYALGSFFGWLSARWMRKEYPMAFITEEETQQILEESRDEDRSSR